MIMKLRDQSGATLLEIIIAMVVIGLVAGGIMAAFVFSRRVNLRSAAELTVDGLAQEVSEDLRLAVAGNSPNLNIPVAPGIYYGTDVVGGPAVPAGNILASLNFPPALARFRIQDGNGTVNSVVDGDTDGRFVFIENADENGNGIADEDLDGDGLIGNDFDADNVTDLRRIRVIVNFTTPSAQ